MSLMQPQEVWNWKSVRSPRNILIKVIYPIHKHSEKSTMPCGTTTSVARRKSPDKAVLNVMPRKPRRKKMNSCCVQPLEMIAEDKHKPGDTCCLVTDITSAPARAQCPVSGTPSRKVQR